jgi:EpsI family protein
VKTSRLLMALVLVAAVAVFAKTARLRAVAPTIALEALPLQLGAWHGRDAGPLDRETIRILAADSYLNRSYEEARTAVGLYIAYYAQQRPGVSIHSPLHCLPGTGWEPLDVAGRTIARPDGSSGALRRLLVRKGRDRALVLYWYAVHGRMIGNELLSKAWLLHDSIRYDRSDAALVRVVVPVNDSVDAAERKGLAFVRTLLPRLAALWS